MKGSALQHMLLEDFGDMVDHLEWLAYRAVSVHEATNHTGLF